MGSHRPIIICRRCEGQIGLEVVDVDDSLGKCLRHFLWQIVPDATIDHSMLVFAGEFPRIRARIRVGCAVRIALEGDRRHIDDRAAASRFSMSS